MSYQRVTVGNSVVDLHERIRIAIGHCKVSASDIEASYLNRAVCTRKRLKQLNQLLNDVVRSGSKDGMPVDLLALPEVSIPHSWKQMLVGWARKRQIGIICGLEHRIDRRNHAINEILAALPYRGRNGRNACLPLCRTKRFYSPEEIFVLTNNHLSVPEHNRAQYPEPQYHLIGWRGVSFAIYNCYELANISDRALFKGKVDFIVCSEFNRDVSYFSNIVESAARDLHCFVIQVNDSQFGDSRVVSPSNSLGLNPLRIKGGDNGTYLTMQLNLRALREHQRKGYGLQKDSTAFKPTPPGFSRADVQARIALGQSHEP